MFNAANILEALKNYIHTRGGTSNAYNIAEAVNDLNSIPQGSGGDIPPEVSNAVETHGMGWTESEPKEGFDIQWDGNTEGLDVAGQILFKIADTISISEAAELVGANLNMIDNGTEFNFVIEESDISEQGSNISISLEVLEGIPSILIVFEEFEITGATVSKGVYFVNVDGFYTSRLYKEASTKEVVHKIDSKYLSSAMIVNLTFVDFDTPITADKTLLELSDAFSNGIPVIARLYVENQLVISAQCSQNEDPYEACEMYFGGSIYRSYDGTTVYTIQGRRKFDDDEETIIDFWECPILA